MMRKIFIQFWLLAALVAPAPGAEKVFTFTEPTTNRVPANFRPLLFGEGKPGQWEILYDDVPPLLAPLSEKAPTLSKRAVLGQLSQDSTDDRYPILVYDGETFGDFTLTTRFKLVGGATEQMAGIVFRVKDSKNFYVIRASGLGRNIRFYKVVNGERTAPIGPEMEIPVGVWHELKIECKGNQISSWLNGKEVIPTLTDNTFAFGQIGFWTKSDAVSYFTDTKIVYVPREIPARALVREMVEKYGRLKGLKVYVLGSNGEPEIVASKDEAEHGLPGGLYEKDCLTQGRIFYGNDKKEKIVSVVQPLRDRNGDTIAAVRVMMESGAGQTEQNALARALPIMKEMQARVQALTEFTR